MKLFEIALTKTRAETLFMFGGCGSFALALQELIGGEIFILSRRGEKMHAFLRVGDKRYDVKGERSTGQMALGIVGSLDDFKVEGPVTRDQITFKIKDKDILKATEYIKANPKMFGLT